jgi:hypothetical protein
MNEIGEPYWSERPVILVAGGPSLRGFDLVQLASLDAWLVGINDSIFHLPRCDCGVTVDQVYVGKRSDRLKEKIDAGMEMIVATNPMPHSIGAIQLPRRLTNKLSDNPKEITTCGTSGYGALNVAYLKRAKKILLLGYDYSYDGSHYYDDYEWCKPPKRADCWAFWARYYESTRAQLDKAKIAVFNASPKSAINAFNKGGLAEGLAWVSNGVSAAA